MNSIKQNTQPHLRIIIRKRVKELLKLHADIDERVFVSRPSDIWLTEVPLCLVYFADDSVEKPDTKPRYYNRTLELNIHFLNRWEKREELELVDDWFDSREFESIYAMEINYAEGGNWLGLDFIQDCYLVRSIPITLEGRGNKDIESNKIIYNVEYDECLNYLDPNNLSDFKSLYANYFTVDPNPGDPSGVKKKLAEDQINFV